jgi:hypothetical protein
MDLATRDVIDFLVVALSVFFWWKNRQSVRASTKQSESCAKKDEVDALRGIIAELKEAIADGKKREATFERRVVRLLNRITYLTDGIRVLVKQLEAARITPCWSPEDWDAGEDEPEDTA